MPLIILTDEHGHDLVIRLSSVDIGSITKSGNLSTIKTLAGEKFQVRETPAEIRRKLKNPDLPGIGAIAVG